MESKQSDPEALAQTITGAAKEDLKHMPQDPAGAKEVPKSTEVSSAEETEVKEAIKEEILRSKDAVETALLGADQPEAIHAGQVPDPDEDDLDDLDDMLDEFAPSVPSKVTAPAPSKSSNPPTAAPDPLADGISDDDFAKQLQAGMAELMGELDTSPDMQAQFENMLKELDAAGTLGEAAGLDPVPELPKSEKPSGKAKIAESGSKSRDASTAGEESFQDTIKKTMERMQASGDSATAAATSENTDDILAEMMRAMQASGGLDGEGGEEEFSKMLLGMMEQLTNKEILYEPMKELNDKFPDWMEKNAGKAGEEDLKRYQEQQIHVREIVNKFEEKTYKDENAADREYIVERMQKMQAAGSPPPDLVGDMAAAQEAFGAPEEGCPTQ